MPIYQPLRPAVYRKAICRKAVRREKVHHYPVPLCTGSAFLAVVFTLCINAAGAATQSAVVGYADLHSHPFAEHSFGGSWFHGNIEGSEEHAVARCDGNFLTQTHAATRYGPVSEFVAGYNGLTSGDTGIHLGKRRGYDPRRCQYFLGVEIPGTCPKEHYEHWPSWDTIAHQQMWKNWIRQAHQEGLQLMVASLVESKLLCEVTPRDQRRYSCDEMASIRRQIDIAADFVANNSNWVEIATSSAHARDIIASGKLAFVISIEVTDLFSGGDFVQQLQYFYQRGVRSVQLVHHADSEFAGAVPIPRLVTIAQLAESLDGSIQTDIDDIVCRNAAGASGDCDGDLFLNEQGLTSQGRILLDEMIARDMLVDVAHMSRKALVDTYNIFKPIGYPMFYSHAHFWDTIDASMEKNEKYITPQEISMIVDTQGMVGLRTGPEKTVNYAGTAVGDNCDGSSYSYAQSLAYAVDRGLNVAFGSDFNGFIQQMLPRKGDAACWNSSSEVQAQAGTPDTSSPFDRQGLGHIGLLPRLLQDLQLIGLESRYTDHLNNSAEAFLQMWQRAESAR